MQKTLRYKSLAPLLAAFFLGGCDHSLRIPFPSLYRDDSGISFMQEMDARIDSFAPSNPGFGETVTLQVSGLHAGYSYSVYLSSGNDGGGDPEEADPQKMTQPYFRIGKLSPDNPTATLSFEVRALLGTDQYGEPFKLARGQLVNISLTGRKNKNGTQAMFMTSSGESLLIK